MVGSTRQHFGKQTDITHNEVHGQETESNQTIKQSLALALQQLACISMFADKIRIYRHNVKTFSPKKLGKSCCEHAMDLYDNMFKNASYVIMFANC